MAVELGGEEAGPAHLAVADDVDAGRLLVAQGQVHRVVQHLGEIRRPELATLGGVDAGHEPGRTRVRPDDAGEQAVGHAAASVKANRRAGLSTKKRFRASASWPAAPSASENPSSSQVRPGSPPNAW